RCRCDPPGSTDRRNRPAMIIADSHLHLFRRGYRGIYGQGLLTPEIEVYERLRAVHEIAAGLVIGYEGDKIEADNNAYIRSLAIDRPWIATLAYIDPVTVPDPQRLSNLLSEGHVGVALYVTDAASADALRRWPNDAWKALNERHAILSLNMAPEFAPDFARRAEALPDCPILISHLGLPGSYRRPPDREAAEQRLGKVLRLAALPNANIKISGLYAISSPSHAYPHDAAVPFIDLALDRFG